MKLAGSPKSTAIPVGSSSNLLKLNDKVFLQFIFSDLCIVYFLSIQIHEGQHVPSSVKVDKAKSSCFCCWGFSVRVRVGLGAKKKKI